jgi:hypothetical protein
MEITNKTHRYIEEDYSKYKNGIYWIWSDVGRGKTESIRTCTKPTIVVCGSNELGFQIHLRHPEIVKDIHKLNLTSSTTKKVGWEDFQGFVNYESFHHLKRNETFPHFLIIDEPAQLWKQASQNLNTTINYSTFLKFLRRTPVVILLGYDQPHYIIDELEEISQKRGDVFKQIRYE